MTSSVDNDKMIMLKSMEGEIFGIKYKNAIRSKLIKSMLDDGITLDDDEPVPLINVDARTLDKIVQWLNHHENDPMCDDDSKNDDEDNFEFRRSDDIDEWDVQFLAIDHALLFKLVMASNYMDIKPLLDVTCKTVANLLKGKTPQELKKTFHITNNFTPEEIEEIKRENEWCENE